MIDNRQVHIHTHPETVKPPRKGLGFLDLVFLIVLVLPICISIFGGYWGGVVWAAVGFLMAGWFGRLVFGFFCLSFFMNAISHADAETVTECYKVGNKVVCSKRSEGSRMPTRKECYYIGRKLVCKEY